MKYFIIIFTCILFYNCQNNHKPIEAPLIKVDMSGKNIVQDSLFSSREIVFLETTENSLLGMLSKIVITNDRIYIFDEKGKKILAFGRDGHFLENIGKYGRGPGESVGLTDFFVDEKRQEIVVYSNQPYKFMFFDLDGRLKSEIPCDQLYYAIAACDTNQIACINAVSNDLKHYVSLIKHDGTQITHIDKIPLEHFRASSTFALGFPMLKSNHILFTKRYDNHLYLLDNGKAHPYYKFDFDKQNFQETLLQQNLSDTKFDQEVSAKQLIYSIVNPKETSQKIFFNTHQLGTFVLDKKTESANLYKSIKDKELDIEYSRMIPTEDANNQYICFERKADELKMILPYSKCTNQDFKDRVDKTSENDNPILFIYTTL